MKIPIPGPQKVIGPLSHPNPPVLGCSHGPPPYLLLAPIGYLLCLFSTSQLLEAFRHFSGTSTTTPALSTGSFIYTISYTVLK